MVIQESTLLAIAPCANQTPNADLHFFLIYFSWRFPLSSVATFPPTRVTFQTGTWTLKHPCPLPFLPIGYRLQPGGEREEFACMNCARVLDSVYKARGCGVRLLVFRSLVAVGKRENKSVWAIDPHFHYFWWRRFDKQTNGSGIN